MTVTRTLARRLALAALLLCTIAAAGIALLVTIAEPEPAAQPAQAPAAVVEPAAAPATPAVAEPALTDLDEAFLADLLGPDTDLDPAQAQALIAQATRYCDKVGHPELLPPGAEVQTRDGWLASLTMAGDPHALTMSEAVKLLDTATAAYCPELFTADTLSAPLPVVEAAPQVVTPAVPAQAATEAPAPAGEPTEPEVAEQLADEVIGGARCDDPAQVVVAQVDGAPVCGQA